MFLSDDSDSLWQACIDTDQGGSGPNAERMLTVNQNGYQNAMRREKRRQAKAFAMVYKQAH